MNLLLFDVDGTLVDSAHDDDRLFRETLQEALPADITVREAGAWETFPEVTEPAIVRAIIKQARGRPANDAEVLAVRRAFTTKWQNALQSGEVKLRPQPGAIEVLRQARAHDRFAVAIATGSWGPPALLKLQAAGLPVENLVLVSADDADERATILRTAGIFAASARGAPGFGGSVLVGDGVWDARAAQAIRAGFVAVNADPAMVTRLRSEGAAAVIPHFDPAPQFWNAVETALKLRRAARSN